MKRMEAIWMMMVVMMIVAACGQGGTVSSPEVQAGQPAGGNDETGFPRTVRSANGDMTIGKRPEKVALVHWGLSDILLTFDLSSAAVTLPFTEKQSVLNTDVYKPYVESMDELVIVGENTKVNLEALLAYQPDLIIAGSSTNGEISVELSRIAPTYFVDEEAIDVWFDWRKVMTVFGEVLGQEQQARQYIAGFDRKVSEAKAKLGRLKETVAFVQVREKAMWLQGTSYLPQYYDELGLKAVEYSDMQEGGQLSLEGLSELNPDHLFLGYFNYADRSIPAITDEWEKSEVWKKLKAVQKGRAYPLNGELALGYGPIGKAYGIDEVVKALSD